MALPLAGLSLLRERDQRFYLKFIVHGPVKLSFSLSLSPVTGVLSTLRASQSFRTRLLSVDRSVSALSCLPLSLRTRRFLKQPAIEYSQNRKAAFPRQKRRLVPIKCKRRSENSLPFFKKKPFYRIHVKQKKVASLKKTNFS